MLEPELPRPENRIMVTGAGGFLGGRVVELLQSEGADVIPVGRRPWRDLRELAHFEEVLDRYRPEVVIHCAARVGGIAYNLAHPVETIRDNLLLGLSALDARASHPDVRRLVLVGSVCCYPADAPPRAREDYIWDGRPEGSNGPYGAAKRTLLEAAAAYHRQLGLDVACPVLANLYGPGEPTGEDAHVVGALTQRFLEAARSEAPEVVVWGDPDVTRDLLYVDDAARALLAAARAPDPQDGAPVNVATGRGVRIGELVEVLVDLTGYRGRVVWDASRPTGQRARSFDASRAEQLWGWRPRVGLTEGLRLGVERLVSAPGLGVGGAADA